MPAGTPAPPPSRPHPSRAQAQPRPQPPPPIKNRRCRFDLGEAGRGCTREGAGMLLPATHFFNSFVRFLAKFTPSEPRGTARVGGSHARGRLAGRAGAPMGAAPLPAASCPGGEGVAIPRAAARQCGCRRCLCPRYEGWGSSFPERRPTSRCSGVLHQEGRVGASGTRDTFHPSPPRLPMRAAPQVAGEKVGDGGLEPPRHARGGRKNDGGRHRAGRLCEIVV